MLLQYVSDLHLNLYSRNLHKKFIKKMQTCEAPILILAGDLTEAKDLITALYWLANKLTNKIILFVPGNHDYDGSQISIVNEQLRLVNHPRIKVLNGDCFAYGDYIFIGSSGWVSDYDRKTISDIDTYQTVHDLITYNYGVQLGMQSYQYMQTYLDHFKSSGKKIVCITHSLPSYQLVHPRYLQSSLNWFFVNQWMEDLIKEYKPYAWVFGHTHEYREQKIYSTRCLCNPLGVWRKTPIYFNFCKTFE